MGADPISWVRTIAPEDASPRLGALYEAALDPRTGELDNLWRMHSLAPEGLDAHLALYRAAMRGTRDLAYTDRELIAVVVSAANGCHY